MLKHRLLQQHPQGLNFLNTEDYFPFTIPVTTLSLLPVNPVAHVPFRFQFLGSNGQYLGPMGRTHEHVLFHSSRECKGKISKE